MELQTLHVQIPKALKEELRRIKETEGVPVAFQVRVALERLVESRKGNTGSTWAVGQTIAEDQLRGRGRLADRSVPGPIQDRPEMVVVDPLAVERESRSTTRPSVKEGVGPRWKK